MTVPRNQHRRKGTGQRASREVTTLDPEDHCGHSALNQRARPETTRTGRGPSPATYGLSRRSSPWSRNI